jgi:hypothetical protein
MMVLMRLGLANAVKQSMANHRKHRGYRTQKVIAEYLKQWWAYADTAGAGRQGEDILNIPTVSIEVKARSDFQPLAWIKQAEANSNHKLPLVIMRCNGQGEDVGNTWHLSELRISCQYFIKLRQAMRSRDARNADLGTLKGRIAPCRYMSTNA